MVLWFPKTLAIFMDMGQSLIRKFETFFYLIFSATYFSEER